MTVHVASNSRLAGLALLGLLGVVASACSAGAPPSATPSAAVSIASSPSPTSSPEAAASVAPPTLTPSTGPSASASQQPIPDGVYVTAEITRPLALAALKAAGVPVNVQTETSIDAIPFPNSWRMQLDHGRFTRWCTSGGIEQGCDGGTFAFPDAHTMINQDPGGGCITTVALRWLGTKLYLTVVKTTCGLDSLVVTTFSFGSTPWTRKP